MATRPINLCKFLPIKRQKYHLCHITDIEQVLNETKPVILC